MRDRLSWLLIAMMIVWLGFWGRLVVLQLAEGSYYRALADENRIKLIVKPADRGVIYDRYGEMLVRNVPEGREYLYGAAMSHVLGYVGEISEEELERCRLEVDCEFRGGEIVGKMGLEREYDKELRGEDGGLLVEQDVQGEVLREIGNKEPVAGESLRLSLDAGLQRKAYELMEGRKGAIVVSGAESGGILALVSSPGFDPNVFRVKGRDEEADKAVERILTNKDLPMFDRVVGGEYPPGSVFKIVTALAGLEEGKINETTEIEDTGEIVIGPYRFGNWYYDQYGQKEGIINLVRAIARSNDIFFYKVGEWLGIESLSDWAKYLGLGNQTGIDLPGEAYGLMPDPEWKEEFKKESWFLGDTYITAIGQGDILTTPLQVNQMTKVVASGGEWCRPELIKEKEADCQKLDITQKSLETVTEGMRQVASAGGTAFPLFDFAVKGKRIEVAGKTGTAEFGDPEDKTHAWFTSFAPVEKPEIVVTVLLEAAGEGSAEAAPVAKELLSYWFSRQ